MPGRNHRGWRRRTPGRPAPAPAAPIDGETARHLDRIADIARNVRATWFILLGAIAFAGVTLLGVEDADFFAYGRQTMLPLVGVEIPTRSFFWTAPFLVAALYGYFHFQLRQLWRALAPDAVRADMGGRPLADVVHPGLITDWGLRQRPDRPDRRTALDRLQGLVVVLLVWAAAPLVLAGLWWRAMPAHEEGLTLAGAAALGFALFVGWKSFAEARHQLRDVGEPRPRRPLWGMLAIVLIVISWARTEGGLDHQTNSAIAWWNREFPDRALLFGEETWPGSIAEEDARREWFAAQWWIPKALIWEHEHFWDYPLWLVDRAPWLGVRAPVLGGVRVLVRRPRRPADGVQYRRRGRGFPSSDSAGRRPTRRSARA